MLKGVLVIPIVLVILVMCTLAQTQAQQEWIKYEDPILEISIQHPSGWEVKEEPNTVSFSLYDNKSKPVVFADVGVQQTLPFINTSEKLMKFFMNRQRGETADIHRIDTTTLAGKPAYIVDYDFKGEDGTVAGRTVAYFLVDGDTYYAVSFITKPDIYTKYLPTIEKMVDSFKIQ